MEILLYYAILTVLIASFLIERWLDYLNATNWSSKLPSGLAGIYDEEKYKKSVDYEKTKTRFTIITESLGFIAILLIFTTGGFGWLDGIIRTRVNNPIFVSLLFFAVLGFFAQIASLPFSYYETFMIEAKFGFNKSSRTVFFIDQVKGRSLNSYHFHLNRRDGTMNPFHKVFVGNHSFFLTKIEVFSQHFCIGI